MHINSISCGQGSPSLFLIVMAGEGLIPADVVIVADTGWENDMLWNTGKRTTSREFFNQVTKPLADRYGIDAVMVRSLDEDGKPYLPIPDHIEVKHALAGSEQFKWEWYGVEIPLFGSEKGRLPQACTSKWKIQAIRQELRRRGATTATAAIGLHLDEVHRVKPSDMQWVKHSWPLLDMAETFENGTRNLGIGKRYRREDIQREMDARGIPYLVTTECDGCPHKDYERWKRTSPDKIAEMAVFERQFNGQMFLTEKRIPLIEALSVMEEDRKSGMFTFDTCDSGYCFI